MRGPGGGFRYALVCFHTLRVESHIFAPLGCEHPQPSSRCSRVKMFHCSASGGTMPNLRSQAWPPGSRSARYVSTPTRHGHVWRSRSRRPGTVAVVEREAVDRESSATRSARSRSGPAAAIPEARRSRYRAKRTTWRCCAGFALGSAPRHIAATLHIVEGPKQSLVEVRIDDQPAGTLTKGMGEQVRDLVSFVSGKGRVPVVRALIKGSTLRADVTLYVARTVDVPHRWLDSVSQAS